MSKNQKRRIAALPSVTIIASNRFLVIGGLVVALLAIYCVGNQFLEKTKYISLPIPSPSSDLPQGDWTYTEYATRVWNDSGAKYYVHRREVDLHSTNFKNQEYKTWQDVFAYFNDWLSEYDWKLYEEPLYDPCANFLPESEFMPRGEGGYVVYRRIGSTPFMDEPTVCLAIWEIPTSSVDANDVWYHIVITTANPSILTRFNSQ